MKEELIEIVRLALAEDLGTELSLEKDFTGQLLDEKAIASGIIKTNEPGILAGTDVFEMTFRLLDEKVKLNWLTSTSDAISPDNPICEIKGSLRSICAAERVALNFLSHLSGVATLTSKFVKATNGQTKIYDTRKTTPTLRAFEKAAVVAGGGYNHRFSLSDAILIKDNHLTQLDIKQAVAEARKNHPDLFIEVECDTIQQVEQALQAKADGVLLDNMMPKQISKCVKLVKSSSHSDCVTEASGGIHLSNIHKFAKTGVDRISVGALTKSTRLDMGLDINL